MEHLTLEELATLNRLVRKQKSRFLLDISKSEHFQKPDDECSSYIQRSRAYVEKLSTIQDKLERMILESE